MRGNNPRSQAPRVTVKLLEMSLGHINGNISAGRLRSAVTACSAGGAALDKHHEPGQGHVTTAAADNQRKQTRDHPGEPRSGLTGVTGPETTYTGVRYSPHT